MISKFARLASAALVLLAVQVYADAPLWVEIKHDDPKLYYVGRFDRSNDAGPRCEWPASMVTLRFKGTAAQVTINESKQNYWAVVVDDKPAVTVPTKQGDNLVDLATELSDGEHTVQLVRRTESFVSRSQIKGFRLNVGGALLEPKKLTRKIQVIGDSISCGYGNEAPNQKEKFKAETENAHMTYGAIAARAVGAEYVCIAWSGKKMAPDNTIPEIYGRALPTDKNNTFDTTQWVPDVILINLSTNDFNKADPDQEMWTKAYKDFVLRLRKDYPNAAVYMATSPMLWNSEKRKQRDVLRKYLDRIQSELRAETGDQANFRIMPFPQQKQENGLGADWHPSVKTNEVMAAQFAEALKADLGWDAAAAK